MSGRHFARTMVLLSVPMMSVGVAVSPAASTLAVAQSASIAGHIFDAGGQPLAGVSVTTIAETGGPARSTQSGRDGAYAFDTLPAGTYRVDFDLLGFDLVRLNHVLIGADATAQVNATLPVSSICECVEFRFDQPLKERAGQVLDESGRPLAHARIEIVNPMSRAVAYADGEGRFRVRVPLGESWPLTASDSGFARITQHVSGTAAASLVFRLPRSAQTSVPEIERFPRGCRCPGDLFTHHGR